MTLSIIIVNYHSIEFLISCIESIYTVLSSCDFEVIIVNNSPEEDISSVSVNRKNLKIIENSNRGFANACNIGAFNSSGNYLFFLNPDTTIQNDDFDNAIKTYEQLNAGIFGFKLINQDLSLQLSFGEEINIEGEIKNKHLEKEFRNKSHRAIEDIEIKYSEITPVNWVSGAAMMVSRAVFDKVNGFDERFFLYYEDSDLCKRISLSGNKNYYYPFIMIMHLKGENTNSNFINSTYFIAKQSQLLYYKIHLSKIELLKLRLYLFAKFSIKYLTTFKPVFFKIILLAAGLKK